MRRLVLVGLAFLPLSACASGDSPYMEPNALMGEEITNRVQQIPFQHREELFQNLLWLAQVGEQAIPELIRALQSTDPKVRSSAAWVLGRMGDRRTIPELKKLTSDSNPVVRMETARSLLGMGDMEQAPALIEGLDSERAEVRYMCHEALKSATGREFGYDHLSEDLLARRQAVLEWRTWWAEMSGDRLFASSYANQNGLPINDESPMPPAVPMGETRQPGTENRDGEPPRVDPDNAGPGEPGKVDEDLEKELEKLLPVLPKVDPEADKDKPNTVRTNRVKSKTDR